MRLEFLIQYIAIPSSFALIPAIVIRRACNRYPHRDNKLKKWVLAFYLVWSFLFVWSYYNVWSLLYGPMSSEDWGPGIVSVIGIIMFQVSPLLITTPFALWIFFMLKKYNKSFHTDAQKAAPQLD